MLGSGPPADALDLAPRGLARFADPSRVVTIRRTRSSARQASQGGHLRTSRRSCSVAGMEFRSLLNHIGDPGPAPVSFPARLNSGRVATPKDVLDAAPLAARLGWGGLQRSRRCRRAERTGRQPVARRIATRRHLGVGVQVNHCDRGAANPEGDFRGRWASGCASAYAHKLRSVTSLRFGVLVRVL